MKKLTTMIALFISCGYMLATNPSKNDFSIHVKLILERDYPLINLPKPSGTNTDWITNVFAGAGQLIVNQLIVNNTDRLNFLLFSLFTFDMSLARVANPSQKDLRFIGIAGVYVPVNGI